MKHYWPACTSTANHSGSPYRRAGFSRTASILAAVLSVTAFAATNAMAAADCQQIKAGLAQSGSYIYHYRDSAKPNLDLYKRFVNSSLECSADATAEYTNFSPVVDCPVEHCVQMYGRNS